MPGSALRRAVVAGRFYPARAEELAREVDEYLSPKPSTEETVSQAIGCIVPHAGYMYSGHVAGAVFRRLPARSSYVILCPNHTGRGAPLAMMSNGRWQTPLGEVPVESTLAQDLQHSCALLTDDVIAHAAEHSLEVQLPFLQRTAGKFSFVPISIGVGGYAALEALGHGLAKAIQKASRPALIVASSDMNHYEPDAQTRLKDHKAIDQILALRPSDLYEVIRREEISMCGYGPAIAMLVAATDLGARHTELVKYATSADTSGDYSAVVGYAGIIVS
jgi:AmmeMemoRadiSam system protein B